MFSNPWRNFDPLPVTPPPPPIPSKSRISFCEIPPLTTARQPFDPAPHVFVEVQYIALLLVFGGQIVALHDT